MSINCIHRGGCMRAEPCTDYCRANEGAAHSSNERLRELLAEWDGLQGCARPEGMSFDVVLTKRALMLESIVNTARQLVSAPETNGERDGWAEHPDGSVTVDGFTVAPPAETTVDLNAEMWASVKAAIIASPRFAEMFEAGGMLNDGVANVIAWLQESPAETNGDSLARELLAQCEAYHSALDVMFARMIERTKDDEPHCFYVTESGQPWEACQRGHALIQRARSALATTEAAVKPRTD